MASLPTQTQVLIAGGGPVGLALAVELGGRGIDCVVIEPRETVSHARPRCKTLNVRTLEHLRRWGLVDALRARSPLPVEYSQDIVFCTSLAGYELSRFRGVLGLVPEGDRFPEPGQQAPQFVLEELLRDHVAALGTVSLALGHRVSDLDQHDDGVRVTVLDPAGEPVIVEAEYVVGADGPHSAVRGAIGADYVGEFALRPNFGMVFRAPTLEAEVRHGPAVQYWVVNESTPSLLGPLDLQGTWWMIAFGVNREQGEQSARSLIDGAAGMPVDAEVLSTDPWTARMQLVDRAREGRVFLAGDAAHLNPPFGGHGLNTGIGDAVDLGWKLAAMLDGWGGAALLDSYEAERRPVQTEVIAAAEANMRVLASELVTDAIDRKGPEGEQARALTHQNIQRTKHAEFHALNLVLDLAYDNSAIVVPRSDDAAPTAARAGALLPHGWIAPGRSVYDALGPGMSLVMLDDAPDEASHAFSAAARTREVPLTVVRVPSSVFAPKLGTAMALVRPDQHVAWIGGRPPEDPVAVIDQIRGARVGDVADRRQPIPQTDSVDNDRKT